jgi:hypothetical protein
MAHPALKHPAGRVQDNVAPTAKQKADYLRIAETCEEACHLAGNINGPDLDEFEEKYGIKSDLV